MKILDKYIAKNFLIGYTIAFCVLLGLRVIIDLFVNIDEFAEHSALGFFAVGKNILSFYALQSTLYFRDFSGMITVVAAAFSLGKMVKSNELVAVMASGVSLKRIIVPIVTLSFILTGVSIVNQEFIIPPLAPKLVRSHDDIPGEESYHVDFINDANNALFNAQKFDVKTATIYEPTILIRNKIPNTPRWTVTAKISADRAVYNNDKQWWDLVNGQYTLKKPELGKLPEPPKPIAYFESDLTPKELPIRYRANYKTMLSSAQLSALVAHSMKIKDLAQLYSQKHYRVTDPIINMVMLLISLPILVCRDPRTMKSAIMLSFTATTACFIMSFVCKMLATESLLGTRIMPEFWAWFPIFIFLPLAFIELDSMKT